MSKVHRLISLILTTPSFIFHISVLKRHLQLLTPVIAGSGRIYYSLFCYFRLFDVIAKTGNFLVECERFVNSALSIIPVSFTQV